MNFGRVLDSAILGVFSNRAFALFTAGNSLSLVGLWVQRLAVGWLTWELTQSGFWLGAVAFADLFPVVFIGPFGGVLADRTDRKMILVVCKALAAVHGLALAALIYADLVNIEVLFGLSLLGGIVIAVQQPARLAIVPSLVTAEYIGPAVAINSVIFNLARFVGPAVAGLLIAWAGIAEAFVFVGFSHAAIVFILLGLNLPSEKAFHHQGIVAEFVEGIRYAFTHPALGPLLILSIIGSILARPVYELLPGFADEVFHQGADGFAILTSAVGFGAVAAGLYLAQRTGIAGLTAMTIAGFALSGVLCVIFGLFSGFWVGVVAIALSGTMMVVFGTGAQTLLQSAVDDRMRGRVLSVWGITFRGGPAVGALAMGWLAEFWGFGPPVAMGGIVCVIIGVVVYRRRAPLIALLEGDQVTK
ncbi:MAG: MFS transporter [Rhodospirillales bacterium]|jgi:MFS family permease|nr:MFS transporter [Rhodospirillales bacterium]